MKKIIFLALIVACADVWAMELKIRPGYNKEASEALFEAVMFSCTVERVERAIAVGADVDVKSHDGYTPLHLATQNNETEVMEALIAAGADVNAKTNDGYTPLHLAVKVHNETEAIKVLIAAGADVNTKDNDNRTPLLLAVHQNSKELTDVLIKARANVNTKGIYGSTPLHMSAGNNSKELIDRLITAGADVNVKNKNGHTPLDFAVSNYSRKAIKKLIESGAKIPDGLSDEMIEQFNLVIEKINTERKLYNDALRGLSALEGKNGRMNSLMFERLYAPRLPLISEVYAQRQAAEAI